MSPFGFGKKGAELPPQDNFNNLTEQDFIPENELIEPKSASLTNPEKGVSVIEPEMYYGETARWSEVLKDPEVKVAAAAAIRTIINSGIALTEIPQALAPLFPVLLAIGIPAEAVSAVLSGSADLAKVLQRALKTLRAVKGNKFDLTPDLTVTEALSWEGADWMTLGVVPSHLIEGGRQFLKADMRRIGDGIRRAKQMRSGAYTRYRENAQEIDGAMDAFLD